MEHSLAVEDFSRVSSLFGVCDTNLRFLENHFGVRIFLREENLLFQGTRKNVQKAEACVAALLHRDKPAGLEEIKEMILAQSKQAIGGARSSYGFLEVPSKKKFIDIRTVGQKRYVDAMKRYDIVFAIGPGGSGKTYLAAAMAVHALAQEQVKKIVLTRPALEAGESLGYLPGTIREKLNPYLRPLYDSLHDMMDINFIENYCESGIIEIAPLAYMRGRTLHNSFIILDEAQNCTKEQLKMFLTRLGFSSRAVITGDITQTDLPSANPMGLVETLKIVRTIPEIKVLFLTEKDIVRHPLVKKIVKAYEKNN